MSNGTHVGFPGPDGGVPDFEQPPVAKDGPGGGPASPWGVGGFSSHQKETADATSDALNAFAAGSAGIAAGAVGLGASAPFGGVVGVLSAIGWVASQLFNEISDDPPQPYQGIVTFEPRLSRPPGMTDPILSRLGIASQRGVFASVTARCLIDATERLAGAQQARDQNWAVTHYGVALQCYQTLVVDVATLASNLYAAAQVLVGSEFDLPLKPATGGVGQWIESRGTEANISKEMDKAGLLAAEIEGVIQWWRTDPKYSGLETTFSGLLLSSANKLYSSAQKLAR